MRLQTRLFLGAATLVMAVTASQWWLHRRQEEALRLQLGDVATSVGRGLLMSEVHLLPGPGHVEMREEQVVSGAASPDHEVQKILVSSGGSAAGSPTGEVTARGTADGDTARGGTAADASVRFDWVETPGENSVESVFETTQDGNRVMRHVQRYEFRVDEGEAEDQRFLVVTAGPGVLRRIPIPVAPTVEIVERGSRQGLAAGLGVLLLGLVASAVMARRVAAPLQRLAAEAESLGRGVLGVQVPEGAGGEVGELQRAFNRMSSRLAELERERSAWRDREHLAQLGDIARGLAHTVRNPLNTLGLAVEELAGEASERRDLVVTARGQIRRIDRWLRSFLAVGANGAAAPELLDLGDLVRSVVLEAVQQGAAVDFSESAETVRVEAVPGALRAAIANLVENAVHASPPETAIEVAVERRGERAEVRVRDTGPGLPEAVRDRLWEPHVTTRPEGSGMGLYLARQLVVNMHGGSLELEDAPGGGTVAVVRLPLPGEGTT